MKNNLIDEREDLIIGRNAAMEAVKGNRTIEAIYVAKGQVEGSINAIMKIAKEKKLVIKEVDRKKLDIMSGGAVHQGIIVRITPYKYSEVSDILSYAKEKGVDFMEVSALKTINVKETFITLAHNLLNKKIKPKKPVSGDKCCIIF